MLRNARRWLALAILCAALTAAGLVSPARASADSLGGLDVIPAKGNAQTPMSVVTERGCAEPAERVSAVLTGKGMPKDGQVVLSPTEVLFSTTRPMELPLSNAFVVYADRNATALSGKYTITVRCTDRIGVNVLDTFSTTMTWKTPGGSAANAAKATYVAQNTAGVVNAEPAPGSTSGGGSEGGEGGPSAAAPEDPADQEQSSSDDPTPAPGPGERALANDELPDGSNPDARAATDGVTAAAESGDDGSSGAPWLVLLAVGLLLAGAGAVFLRGRGGAES
jgi:hypothetical protein